MNHRKELRKQFKENECIDWINDQGAPDINYVHFLEDKIKQHTSIELSKSIYKELLQKGCEIGNASIFLIQKVIEEFQRETIENKLNKIYETQSSEYFGGTKNYSTADN
jgi:hypothetical protein